MYLRHVVLQRLTPNIFRASRYTYLPLPGPLGPRQKLLGEMFCRSVGMLVPGLPIGQLDSSVEYVPDLLCMQENPAPATHQ
jgi:hypothetical protein